MGTGDDLPYNRRRNIRQTRKVRPRDPSQDPYFTTLMYQRRVPFYFLVLLLLRVSHSVILLTVSPRYFSVVIYLVISPWKHDKYGLSSITFNILGFVELFKCKTSCLVAMMTLKMFLEYWTHEWELGRTRLVGSL